MNVEIVTYVELKLTDFFSQHVMWSSQYLRQFLASCHNAAVVDKLTKDKTGNMKIFIF